MQPLFADIGEVIGFLITLAIIGFSVISKIISAANGGDAKPGPRRVPQPEGPAQRPRAHRPDPLSMEAEIEDFLRQARGDRAVPPAPPKPPVVEAVPFEATPVPDEVVPGQGFGRDLATHVSQHIGHDSISRRDAQLADAVEAADERVEKHLQEVFDHDVGRLAHADAVDTSIQEGTDAADATSAEKQPDAAAKIAEMLKTPQSIRNMFIVSEILKRPEI